MKIKLKLNGFKIGDLKGFAKKILSMCWDTDLKWIDGYLVAKEDTYYEVLC